MIAVDMSDFFYITNPYYAEKMIEGGVSSKSLKIITNFFEPNEKDLMKIDEFLKDCETIVDIGSGYGLLINSLAQLNQKKSFLGIDTMYCDKKFIIPNGHKNVKFEYNGIENMVYREKPKRMFDCSICCWIPSGSDWREMLSKISNKKIIFILDKGFSTGTIDCYIGFNQFGFKLSKSWSSESSIIQLWEKSPQEADEMKDRLI